MPPAMMLPGLTPGLNPAAAALYGAALSRTHLPHLTPHLNIYGQSPPSGLDWTKIPVWGRMLSEFEIKILKNHWYRHLNEDTVVKCIFSVLNTCTAEIKSEVRTTKNEKILIIFLVLWYFNYIHINFRPDIFLRERMLWNVSVIMNSSGRNQQFTFMTFHLQFHLCIQCHDALKLSLKFKIFEWPAYKCFCFKYASIYPTKYSNKTNCKKSTLSLCICSFENTCFVKVHAHLVLSASI